MVPGVRADEDELGANEVAERRLPEYLEVGVATSEEHDPSHRATQFTH